MLSLAAIGAALRRIPGWAYVLFILVAAGLYYGHTRYNAGQADVQAKWDESVAEAEKVRLATEQAWNKAVWDLAYAAELKRAEREQETERTIADLRSGTVRLRDRFTCPAAKASGAAAKPVPEESGLRIEDAEFLVRFADEADAIADERNQCIASYNALRAK
jgi:hypothetical protein